MPCVWLRVCPLSVEPRKTRWAAVDPVALWQPMRRWFPPPPTRILEIGAGTGRDAAWFSTLGYRVTCVEPNRDLWPDGTDWLADGLPDLNRVRGTYDLITIGAVWHLLPEHDRSAAFARIADLALPGARLILSLRIPPLSGAADVVGIASHAGWQMRDVSRRPSHQLGNRKAGVVWDWCVFERVASA